MSFATKLFRFVNKFQPIWFCTLHFLGFAELFALQSLFEETSALIQLGNAMGLFSSKTIEVEMDGAVANLVQDLIAKNDVVIFSKTYCPYCNMAKEVFDKVKHDYKTIELDNREDGNVIQAYLGQLTGAKSVPRVFVKGQCVGGGTDVKKLFDDGELVKILQA